MPWDCFSSKELISDSKTVFAFSRLAAALSAASRLLINCSWARSSWRFLNLRTESSEKGLGDMVVFDSKCLTNLPVVYHFHACQDAPRCHLFFHLITFQVIQLFLLMELFRHTPGTKRNLWNQFYLWQNLF